MVASGFTKNGLTQRTLATLSSSEHIRNYTYKFIPLGYENCKNLIIHAFIELLLDFKSPAEKTTHLNSKQSPTDNPPSIPCYQPRTQRSPSRHFATLAVDHYVLQPPTPVTHLQNVDFALYGVGPKHRLLDNQFMPALVLVGIVFSLRVPDLWSLLAFQCLSCKAGIV